jgi:hypothetical protein
VGAVRPQAEATGMTTSAKANKISSFLFISVS